MKIAPKDIEQFINNIPKNFKAILLYGPDPGLVKVRSDIIKASYHKNIEKLQYEQIKHNPSLILDSLRSINLFGENASDPKLLLIESNTSTISENIVELIREINYSGLLLFCAGDLGPDSSLRKNFEKEQNFAAIPCYIDDKLSVINIIEKQFKQKSLSYDRDLPAFLVNYIAIGNHQLILNELEKIFLFLEGKKHIKISDLEIYLELQGEINFERLCYQISLKKSANTELLLNKLQNEGHNLVSLIRIIIKHFDRLYQAKHMMKQGLTEKSALDRLTPPIFFKQVSDFCQSLKLWKEEDIISFLKKLNAIELLSKQNIILADLSLRKEITNFL